MTKIRLQPQDVVDLYTNQHLTCEEISKLAGVSRQRVWLVLKKMGVPASNGERVAVTCAYCGSQFTQTRRRWRQRVAHYCSDECYFASRANPDFRPDRYGTRLARAIVAQHFPLEPLHVVHHIDSNQANNDLANLLVFLNQSEHSIHHHQKNHVSPIWKGSDIRP